MITLTLDWREVLWWMQGGMAGSHQRWSVYEDMVNKVWPQCSEQERRNLWFIMRRDLGYYWRPDGWSGFDRATAHGEGLWKADNQTNPNPSYSGGEAAAGFSPGVGGARGGLNKDPDGKPKQVITDLTPWKYFRQVLARFDPENQWAVTLQAETDEEIEGSLRGLSKDVIISTPTLMLSADGTRYGWRIDAPIIVRTYKWNDPNGHDAYFVDWRRRCDPDRIVKAERIDIPDNGTM